MASVRERGHWRVIPRVSDRITRCCSVIRGGGSIVEIVWVWLEMLLIIHPPTQDRIICIVKINDLPGQVGKVGINTVITHRLPFRGKIWVRFIDENAWIGRRIYVVTAVRQRALCEDVSIKSRALLNRFAYHRIALAMSIKIETVAREAGCAVG